MHHRSRVKLVVLATVAVGSGLAASLAACSLDIDGTAAEPTDSGPSADVTVFKQDGGSSLDASSGDAADARAADSAPPADAGSDANDGSDASAADGGPYAGNNAALFTGDPSGFVDVSKAVATGDFTLEAWIAPSAVQGTSVDQGNQLLIADVPGPNHNDWSSYLYNFQGSPRLAFTTGVASGPDSLGITDTAIPVGAAPPSWTHVAIVRLEAIGQVRFYLNGSSEVDTPDASTVALDSPMYMAIGGSILLDGGAPRNGFSGLIDEVRVWNYARAGTDIATDLVDQLGPAETADPKLVLYYKFDEATGAATVHDSSGANLTGTVVGDAGARPTFVAVTNR